MRLAKTVGLVVVGIVVGASGITAIRSSQAQPSNDTRLVVSYTGQSVGDDNLVFVQDAKTGACWLAAYGASGGSHSIALAVAPAESCQ
jgi:hypothetical protein